MAKHTAASLHTMLVAMNARMETLEARNEELTSRLNRAAEVVGELRAKVRKLENTNTRPATQSRPVTLPATFDRTYPTQEAAIKASTQAYRVVRRYVHQVQTEDGWKLTLNDPRNA